ncbi:MAG: RNA pseudouridine synthase [Alistipes sp.]|nr:RNA pseudouridine synthase [Alistipes sp.]
MLHRFKSNIEGIALPEKFTWPFHYVPHALSRLAADEVMEYVASRTEWQEELTAGKMFGVLVVEAEDKSIGFLAAFSGNIAGENFHDYFVPPVYDMLKPTDFFRQGEAEISAINQRIKHLEQSEGYRKAKEGLSTLKASLEAEWRNFIEQSALRKADRDRRRQNKECDEEQLILESQRDNADKQRLKRRHKTLLAEAEAILHEQQTEIESLRKERHSRSAALQTALFKEFKMLNQRGEQMDLIELFAPTPQILPPAGAGECAAPKLLQYAYLNNLKPKTMAEFWWGESPRGEVRKHGSFYPACNSKCKPILTFMMQGLDVEPNPLTEIAPPEPKILFEDDYMVVIDKPCGMLSVDGKSGVRSAEGWFKEHYPTYDGPAIVHRLDQSTSGILVLAKNKDVHKELQSQFITRSVKKCYIALLQAKIEATKGQISLPLKLDYDNRPRQMVSADGKSAITDYEVIGYEGNNTRVRFYPLTGRTHQLRVHSAHSDGLNAPIIGDDIYGSGQNADNRNGHRLCLHAERLEFTHPIKDKRVEIESKAEF